MKGTPRPTRLGWLPLVAAPVLGVLSVMTVDSWLLLLAGASLGLGVAAIALRPRLADLYVTATVPARAAIGDTVTTTLTVRNGGRRTSPLTTLTHTVPGLADVTVVVDSLRPGRVASACVARTAIARGHTLTSLARLVSSAPLGLVVTAAIDSVATPLIVHPALVGVQRPGPGAFGAKGVDPVAERSGLDIHGIREWRPGDQARQVHWRSTARRGRLVVLERETPRGGTLTVLIMGPASEPGFEPLVSVVASTALAALSAGRLVTLLAAQPHLDPLRVSTSGTAKRGGTGGTGVTGGTGRGDTSRTRLLDWCSALDPPGLADAHVIGAALTATGHRGVLYVAAPAPPAPWWQLAGSLAEAAGVHLAPLPLARR